MARSFQGCPGALYMSAVLVWATVLYCSVCANLCSAQAINDGALVLVSTPTELQQTLNLRNLTANVLVRDHLNMVGSPSPTLSNLDSTILFENSVVRTSAYTKSIVGNCSEAGPAPAGFGLTEPLPPGACAIYVEQEFMDVIQDVTLWISNLYLVLAPKVGAKPSGLILHSDGDIWITDSVLQGAGTNGTAIWLTNWNLGSPRMWIEGVTITGFTGSDAPGVLLDNNTTITLKNVTFRDMNLMDHPHKDNPATAGSAIQAWGGAGVLMEEVQIINNTVHGEPAGAKAIARHGAPCPAVLYSLPVFDVWDWTDQVAVPADLVTLSNDRGNGDPSQGFLLGIQLEQLQQERSRALGAWHRANQPPLDLGAFPAAGEDSREDPTLPPSPPLQAPSQRGVAALPSSSPAGDDDRTPRVAQEEPTDGRIGDAGGDTGVGGVNAVLVIACSVCVSLVVGCL